MKNTEGNGMNEESGVPETPTPSPPMSAQTFPRLAAMNTGVAIAARLHQGTRSLGPTLLERAQGGRAVEARDFAKRRVKSE
ncbi:unnamed protein product [Hydatigera taeniaeformis]|uniref:Uncharacterized protein n=1 Tax=Hydatigena taeniaeformis TaxID=6205 RepID=A0A0R3X8N9_HYDTA|nr:unnamed protein product [Hydatigera taeniaeformis]